MAVMLRTKKDRYFCYGKDLVKKQVRFFVTKSQGLLALPAKDILRPSCPFSMCFLQFAWNETVERRTWSGLLHWSSCVPVFIKLALRIPTEVKSGGPTQGSIGLMGMSGNHLSDKS